MNDTYKVKTIVQQAEGAQFLPSHFESIFGSHKWGHFTVCLIFLLTVQISEKFSVKSAFNFYFFVRICEENTKFIDKNVPTKM